MYRFPANIVHNWLLEAMLLKCSIDVKLCKLECSFIHWFLLHPIDLGTSVSLLDSLLNHLNWEWSQLFYSDHSNLMVQSLVLFKLCLNIKVYLARA